MQLRLFGEETEREAERKDLIMYARNHEETMEPMQAIKKWAYSPKLMFSPRSDYIKYKILSEDHPSIKWGIGDRYRHIWDSKEEFRQDAKLITLTRYITQAIGANIHWWCQECESITRHGKTASLRSDVRTEGAIMNKRIDYLGAKKGYCITHLYLRNPRIIKRLTEFSFKKNRKKAVQRAGGKCEICERIPGEGYNHYAANHIVPLKDGGTNIEWNLMMLCLDHHKQMEGLSPETQLYILENEWPNCPALDWFPGVVEQLEEIKYA